ncbi:argonaute/Dicer protein, PAZ [Tanacetum coccineum]
MCRPVASSSRVLTDGMRIFSSIASVPVQPQTPMQYRPAQSMPPSLTDAMRKFSIGTSTRVASVRVQGQPPMQQIAKTTTNTAVVSLPLVPSSSKLVKPRARQGFGSVGKKIMITANHFLVQLGDKNPHQYDETDNPQETIQALDIVLREVASHERIIVGRSIFSSPLGNGVDYCRGFCQSLRPTRMGLSLSIDMSNAHQAETGQSFIEEQALEIGSRKSLQNWKAKRIQSLLAVDIVAESCYQKTTETLTGVGQYHDGSDDRSQETHHFNLSQQTLELESDYDTVELRELSNRRRVSNLLQNGFGLRLDELLRSHVERKEQASQSEQQESVFENDGVSQAVQSAKGALSSPPAIPQLSRTEREIINGLRIDMVRLQEQMNSLQSTLETCMKMQHELQRSVQQEVWSALSRLSTSGEDSLETCFLCCDNSSYDFSSDRCGRVHVCSNCAKKINWLKLKESVRHP